MKLLALLFINIVAFADVGYVAGGFSATEFTFTKAHPKVQTTDATQATAYSHSIPQDGETWLVTVMCHAAGANTETFKKCASVSRVAGSASINGNVVNMFEQPTPTYAMTIDVSGDAYRVRITGAAADTVSWECIERLEKILP